MLDILLVEEPDSRGVLEEQLTEAGHRVQTSPDGRTGAEHIKKRLFDLAICDVSLPQMDGLSVFRLIRKEAPSTEVILMTTCPNVTQAVSALKEGACDYLTKPFDMAELLLQVRRIDEMRVLRRGLDTARSEGALGNRGSETNLIGQSPGIRRVQEMIRLVAQSDARTLVTGESGTGKEVVARMIHEQSSRRDKPFIAVNFGALAENLVEAELFGHERGAFTGAIQKRDGRFKAADGGTLLLDEVAELPLPAQAKLLRVLQEGVVEPLGTNTAVRVDVRIISATHRNLLERTRTGRFREDLFYRINVIELQLPTLRDRPGDNALLVNHFLARFTPKGAPNPSISPAAWACLSHYPFPGNVRELSHAIEHAMILSDGKEIDVQHLPASMVSVSSAVEREQVEAPPKAFRPLQAAISDFEHAYLLRALHATQGKRSVTAELLGISRKTLWEKLRGNETRKQVRTTTRTTTTAAPARVAIVALSPPPTQQSRAGIGSKSAAHAAVA
ncbi:MAG TPA: sigma-54 dependent transcriptional regulator [Polyangia bacterium]